MKFLRKCREKIGARVRHLGRYRREIARVSLFALLLAAVSLGISLLIGREGAMRTLQGALAAISSLVLNMFGGGTHVVGNTIASDRFALSVVTACTGLFTTGVFAVAVLAYPAGLIAKAIGVGIGISGIFVLNIIRLVSLFFIGVHLPRLFDRAHLLIWQSLVIVFALFLWLAWARKVNDVARKA